MKVTQERVVSERNDAVAQKLLALFRRNSRRVLFVIPPETPEGDFRFELAMKRRYPCFPPYGAGVLAENLRRRGYEAEIVDLNFEVLSQAHRAGVESAFDYNVWMSRLFDALTAFAPDVIGISCMFTMGHQSMKRVADVVKHYDRTLPVVAGGVHVTNATEMVLRDCEHIDFAIKYEGDRILADMLDVASGRLDASQLAQVATLLDGCYVEVDNRIVPETDDLLVSPDYRDLQIGMYDLFGQIGAYTFMRPGKKASTVLSNRGCRAHCSFCSVRHFNGPGVRGRPVAAVVDEIEALVTRYGVQHIMWLDDDLFYNEKRTVALFTELSKRKLGITWDASNGIIAAAITPEIMQSAVESGCVGMTLGIESGNAEILRAVHKPGTLDTFRRAKRILERYPEVFVKGFLMIGFPNETLGMILDTVNFAIELGLDWYPIQILTPLPSTEIYKTMIEAGLIEDNLETSNVAYLVGPHGKLRLREEREKLDAKEFFNVFVGGDLHHVPSPEELRDYWFLVDYKVNYEKILGLENRIKLENIGKMLNDICDRVTRGNALGNLFGGVIEEKLGNFDEALRRLAMSGAYVEGSAYWQKRFEALDLYSILESRTIAVKTVSSVDRLGSMSARPFCGWPEKIT